MWDVDTASVGVAAPVYRSILRGKRQSDFKEATRILHRKFLK